MTPSKHHYFHSGLRIASQTAIEEWSAFETPAPPAEPDVTIWLARPDFADELDDFRSEIPDVGAFVVRGGSEIVLLLDSGVDPRQVNLFLTASIWGALCLQRGLQVLHGSAIRCDNRVFAFSGLSGAGKSTMAASLARAGYEIFVDDTGRLEIRDDRVLLYPSARRLKLWGETVRALGQQIEGLNRVTPGFEKFYVPMPGLPFAEPEPLDTVYLLEWGELGLRRVFGAEALQLFLATATYRPEFVEPLGKKGMFVQNAIQIVRRVPMYILSRPRDFLAIGNSVALLERHWNDDF